MTHEHTPAMTSLVEQATREVFVAISKSAWPVAVTLWWVVAKTVPTLVAICTLVYVIYQIRQLRWKMRRDREQAAEIDRSFDRPIANYGDKAPK